MPSIIIVNSLMDGAAAYEASLLLDFTSVRLTGVAETSILLAPRLMPSDAILGKTPIFWSPHSPITVIVADDDTDTDVSTAAP